MEAEDSTMVGTTDRYTTTAIALHWLLAGALLGLFALGVYMADLSASPAKLRLYNWHKWAGVTVLGLSALRLGWRLAHRPPPLPPVVLGVMPEWQRRAHAATHRLMYLLFFVVPLSGWAYSSAAGYPVVWFGVWALPDLLPVDESLARVARTVHAACAFALGALVVLHVAAALKHHAVDRDGLLARMWPWGEPPLRRRDAMRSRARTADLHGRRSRP